MSTGTAQSHDAASRGLALIVGLGNPGDKYKGTRHNIGFDCIDRLHVRMGSPSIQCKFESQFAKGSIGGRDVCLIWPLTYMNNSGRSVSQIARFYKVEADSILVVCDDLSLPLGKLRIRKSGSSGGQKGLESILQSLSTTDIPRLRIGIDPTPEHWDTADYVLSRFSASDRTFVDESLARAEEAIKVWLIDGIDAVMNQYNRDPSADRKKLGN